VRVYRLRLVGGTAYYGEHWDTRTTDGNGQAAFTLPDGATYSPPVDGGTVVGWVWYATNVEGSSFISYASIVNVWGCLAGAGNTADCGGSTNPHIVSPTYAFPPAATNDSFNIVGFARMTITTPTSYNGSNLRIYLRKTDGSDVHWDTRVVTSGQAVFTQPDYRNYAGYQGAGWRFYREKDGAWFGPYTTSFAYPPSTNSYNFP